MKIIIFFSSDSKFSISSVKSRNLYKYQNYMIKAIAYKNGSRDISANIAAKNINEVIFINFLNKFKMINLKSF